MSDRGSDLVVADVLAAVVSRGDRLVWPAALVSECAASLGASGAGLAVADTTGPVGIVAATDGAGRTGEDLQFALGEGPCRTASQDRRVVHVPDLARDERWVQFGRSALDAGIAAAFSAPLQVGAVLVGVLDVYRATPGPLVPEDVRVLAVYAQAATAVLLLLGDTEDPGQDAAALTDLADIRPVVHQAAGMVAIQLDVDLTTALLRLRAHAFGTGRPLRALAGDVVARRVRFDRTDEPEADPMDHEQRNQDDRP